MILLKIPFYIDPWTYIVSSNSLIEIRFRSLYASCTAGLGLSLALGVISPRSSYSITGFSSISVFNYFCFSFVSVDTLLKLSLLILNSLKALRRLSSLTPSSLSNPSLASCFPLDLGRSRSSPRNSASFRSLSSKSVIRRVVTQGAVHRAALSSA